MAGRRSGKIGCGCLIAALLIAIGIMAIVTMRPAERPGAVPNNAPRLKPATPVWSASVGAVGKLTLPGATGVWIALDEASWDAMIDAENDAANGGPGAGSAIYRLVSARKIRKYPVGTRVRVTKLGIVSRKIEILDGEDQGTQGWVQAELIGP